MARSFGVLFGLLLGLLSVSGGGAASAMMPDHAAMSHPAMSHAAADHAEMAGQEMPCEGACCGHGADMSCEGACAAACGVASVDLPAQPDLPAGEGVSFVPPGPPGRHLAYAPPGTPRPPRR